MVSRHGVAERRACRVVGLARSTHRYEGRRDPQPALRLRLRDLASARPRYGYRRLTVLLRREQWHVNHKRVYRIYREEGVCVRVKRRKKMACASRVRPAPVTGPNQRWSMDLVSDATGDERRFRILTVVDMCTRECLALEAARSLPAPAVTRALDRVLLARPAPEVIQVDNGTEFSCNHFDAWAFTRGIRINYIRPGSQVDNAHIEAFNGRLRDECLNVQWFETLDDARRALADWRDDYNGARPHSRLGDLAPLAFAARFAGLGPRIEPQGVAKGR